MNSPEGDGKCDEEADKEGDADTTPPVVGLTQASLSGTAQDDVAVQSNVWVDGVAYPLSSGTFTTPMLNAFDGKTFVVVARDISDNETTVNVSVNIN